MAIKSNTAYMNSATGPALMGEVVEVTNTECGKCVKIGHPNHMLRSVDGRDFCIAHGWVIETPADAALKIEEGTLVSFLGVNYEIGAKRGAALVTAMNGTQMISIRTKLARRWVYRTAPASALVAL